MSLSQAEVAALLKPFSKSFIRDLERAFTGEARKDAVRAARLGHINWLGRFLECPRSTVSVEFAAQCVAEGDAGMRRLAVEFDLLRLRRSLMIRHQRIYDQRLKRVRKPTRTT